jgi:hypothetical protein
VIPNTVTSIADNTFSGCSFLERGGEDVASWLRNRFSDLSANQVYYRSDFTVEKIKSAFKSIPVQ